MKLRTKLTLFSIALIVIAIFACCLIILSFANGQEMQRVTNAGLADYDALYYSFRSEIYANSELPELPAVKRSFLIQTFRGISGSEEFTLRVGDEILCNNTGFDVEGLFQNARQYETSENGTIQYRIANVNSEDYFLAYASLVVNADTYYISLARNISDVTNDIHLLAMKCFIAGLAVTIIAAGVMWVIVLRSLKPIKTLQASANELAAGQYENRILVQGQDELAVLAADFNSMADAIQAKINELNETAERQQAFINGLSHEMKTPVTSIMLSSETLLGRKVSTESMRRSLERIYDQSQWLERLSQKLMTLVMLQGEIEKRPQSVARLLEAVKETTSDALAENNMNLTVDCDMDTLPMDFDLMRSALVNLVENARKASEAGQTVEIRAHEGVITVADHGKGIPQDELARVMEPFYMVDRSRNKKAGGVGLGLALVKRIAQAHGARVEVDSPLHQGTTVRIIFQSSQR